MHIYTFTKYTCIHTYMYFVTYTYIYTCVYMCIYVYTYMCIDTPVYQRAPGSSRSRAGVS